MAASGQNAIIEQAVHGSSTNNPDFVFAGFTNTLTSDHSTAPGIVSGFSTKSRINSTTGTPGGPGTNVIISPNGGNATISNTTTLAGTSALQTGTTYLVSVSFSGSTTAASPDIVVSCSDSNVGGIDSFNGITSTAFQSGSGYNQWNPVGYITPANSNPTIQFSYYSGVSGRWNVDSILFSPVPPSPLSGTYQYWNTGSPGGSGAWNTTTPNWNTSSTGSGTQGVYTQADISDFNGTAGTVTIAAGGITTDGGLQFDTSGYTIGGGTLTLGSSPSTAGTNIAVSPGITATINSTISAPYGLCLAYLGTLNLGAAPSIGSTVTLAGGKLQLQPGVNASFPSLTGSGAMALGAQTLTVGSDNTSTTYTGVLSDGGSSSPGALIKTGTGKLTLGGNNTLAGTTTVNGGTVIISSDANLGTAPSSVVTNQLTLSNGGRLDFSAVATLAANRGITLGAGGGVLSTPGTGTTPAITGPISGSGSLTIPSGGLDLKSTNNTFSGGLYITATQVDTGGNNLCSVRFDAEGSSGTGKIFVSPTTGVNCTLRNFNTLTNIIVPNNMEVDLWTNTQTNAQIYLAGGASSTNVYAITFSGNINGSAPVNIGLDSAGGSSNPGGEVNLSGNNSLWSGGASLQAGTLGLGSSTALGTGELSLVPQGPAGVLLATTPLTGVNALTNSVAVDTSLSSLTFGGTNSFELAGPIFLYASSTFTVTNSAATILSGSIADAVAGSDFSLTTAGSGTLTLSGANTYDGGTFVTSGTLLVNNTGGSGTGSGQVTVSSGATIGGTGTISNSVDLSGTISPGSSGPGELTTSNETWEAGASYTWEINKAGGSAGANPGWAQANIAGGLTINANSGSPFTINITSLTSSNTPGSVSDFNNSHNYTWSIAHTAAGITGFTPSAFVLNTNGFANNIGSGSFSITNSATDILLQFISGTVSGPSISSIHVSGTSLSLSGSGGTPNGTYRVLATTNVAANLSTWTQIGSGTNDASGNFSFNGSTTPGDRQQFFIIVSP